MLGERLKAERQRLQLSQPQLGELCGAAKRTVIDWEKGATAPDGNQLTALASAGVDVLYVVTGQRGGVVLAPDEAALLDNYRNAPRDQQGILKATSAAFAQSGVKGKAA